MMKSCLLLLALVLAVASAFAPIAVVPQTPTTTTQLEMGLFDGLGGKKKPAADKGKPKQDVDVFAGRGKKVTIRQDEDNAMWIEEDDKGNRKKASDAKKKSK